MTRSPLEDAFAHHVWATQQLLDTCAALPPEQMEATVPGTYGSIIATLRHLVASDRSYLRRLTGDADLARIDEDADSSLGELRAAMVANGDAWTRLIKTEIDPDSESVIRDGDKEVHIPAGIRLAQAVHHGTDHRSQVCTALTTLGVTPPDIDVWAFGDATGRIRTAPLPPS
ncbi:MAG TPA: DinB family protein [Candidatus Limnocylindrales bacterium]